MYLENTNPAYALRSAPDIGAIRETFLLNQLINHKVEVSLPETGDIITEGIYRSEWKREKCQTGKKSEFLYHCCR